MVAPIIECERKLCRYFGRKYTILTGRGATALWIAYSLADSMRRRIILPAMVCLSPLFTVLYADRLPIFADVRLKDATIDPECVQKLLQKHEDVGAVLAVHLYGHPAAMEELSRICRSHGVMLIEDMAQALGVSDAMGKRFGKGSDISILSFGHAKVLDLGGGGALLLDDEKLYEKAKRIAKKLKPLPADFDRLSACYRKLYYTISECGKEDPTLFQVFDLFPDLFRRLYLYRIENRQAVVINTEIDFLKQEVSERREVAELYRRNLVGVPGITLFSPEGSSVPWRFTFRVDRARREKMLMLVRDAGFDVSSWYPSVTEWTPSGREQKRESFPAANVLEKEVVNLWVTRSYRLRRAEELCQLIRRVTEGLT